MKCKRCNVELNDKNYADSVGFSGYCLNCEKEILKKEFLFNLFLPNM